MINSSCYRPSTRSPYDSPLEGRDEHEDPFFDDFFGRGSGIRDFFRMQTGFQQVFRQFEEEIMKGFGNSDSFIQGNIIGTVVIIYN